MNLGKSVYNLLKRQSEVYVSGLGTFKRNHTPSTYDEKRNVYLPPIDYIDFQSNSESGYDFINYIQQLEEIDRAAAKHQVQLSVEQLLEDVRDQGQAKLDDLGYLVSYGQGYVFKALDLSSFNYEPVEAVTREVIEKVDVVVPTSEQIENEPVHNVETEISNTEDTPQDIDELNLNSEETDIQVEKSSNSVWYVLTAVIALGILAVLYFKNKPLTTASDLPDTSAVSQVVVPELPAGDTVKAIQIDTLNLADTTSNDALTVLIPAKHEWQIVIGSHKTLAQAYEQAESYNKAGYPMVRVIPSNLAKNRKKVIWDSYETKAEVDSALTFVQKHIIKDAWPDKINR